MVKEHDVKDANKVLEDYIENLLEAFCKEMVIQAKQNVVTNGHDKTGYLKNSIYWKKTGKMQYEVVASAEYSAFLEYGTKAHLISAKVAKALHWVGSDGKNMFAKEVRHPGTKPSPFMEPAFIETRRKAEEGKL